MTPNVAVSQKGPYYVFSFSMSKLNQQITWNASKPEEHWIRIYDSIEVQDDIKLRLSLHVNNADSRIYLFEFEFSLLNYTIKEGQIYIRGAKYAYNNETPLIPFFKFRFILPENIDILAQEYITIDSELRYVRNLKVLVIKDNKSWYEIKTIDTIVRFLNMKNRTWDIIPRKGVVILEPKTFKKLGISIGRIIVYPFQITKRGYLKVNKKMKITLMFRKLETKTTINRFILESFEAYGDITGNWLIRGQKNISYIQRLPGVILIGDNCLHHTGLAILSYYDKKEGNYVHKVLCLEKNEESFLSKISSKLHNLDYGKYIVINNITVLYEWISKIWINSPTMIIASKELSFSVVPLAVYMNWPLIIVHEKIDKKFLNIIKNIKYRLGADNLLLISRNSRIRYSLSRIFRNVLCIETPRNINMFFYILKYKTNYARKTFIEMLNYYLRIVINPDMYNLFVDNIEEMVTRSTDYVVCVDESLVGEFDDVAIKLATYRNAFVVDVGGDDASTIRNILDYYDPYYVALYGDGDSGEASCFFVQDPVDESQDPDLVATDFYYAERDECHPDGTWNDFIVESFVGRPIATNDYYAQMYIDVIIMYEDGGLSSYSYVKWSALFSYFYPDDASQAVDDRLENAGATYSPLYTRQNGDFTESNVLWELETGIQIAYFNTHGTYWCIITGENNEDDYLEDNEAITNNDLADYSDVPPFIYVDACMTARFAGDGGGRRRL